MDLALNDEQNAIQELFHEFAADRIRPLAADLDENPRFAKELFGQAGELGFYGMRYAEPDGTGMDMLSYLLAVEELAWGSLGVAATCTMQSLMGTHFVHRHSVGEVRERLLGAALRGEVIGTICMTEPDAGSDLFSMTTSAVENDGQWLISGQKTWITAAPIADMFTVFARTGDKELSIFLVERGTEGLTVGRPIEKMGVKCSLTSELSFDQTPATCMLGHQGAGMESLREVLADIRLMTAALALGVGRAAYEDSLAYAQERVQFGKPIHKFQSIQNHLAEMRVQLEAARRLIYWAAWRSDQGMPSADESSMAKLFASEAAVDVCDRATRIMASYGYASEYPTERYLRDARFTLVGGGTSEILRMNIARSLTR
ncbi:MAG: acyl-CoA dehydrogenase [Deltaproteobacteria bacterium]|nr:acyl-CoA dehydrogenase [Deltaproteobacteria bacterium]